MLCAVLCCVTVSQSAKINTHNRKKKKSNFMFYSHALGADTRSTHSCTHLQPTGNNRYINFKPNSLTPRLGYAIRILNCITGNKNQRKTKIVESFFLSFIIPKINYKFYYTNKKKPSDNYATNIHKLNQPKAYFSCLKKSLQ